MKCDFMLITFINIPYKTVIYNLMIKINIAFYESNVYLNKVIIFKLVILRLSFAYITQFPLFNLAFRIN